jgi:hypothetical protein
MRRCGGNLERGCIAEMRILSFTTLVTVAEGYARSAHPQEFLCLASNSSVEKVYQPSVAIFVPDEMTCAV